MLWSAVRLALMALRRNPARSGLTVLGVVIGVAAVITMVTVGNGATQAVSQQIASLGSNLLMVRPGQRMGPNEGAAPFRRADMEAVRQRLGGRAIVAGVVSTTATAIYGGQTWTTQIAGADRSYFEARKLVIASGRGFTEAEEKAGRPVCVLGETVRRELFGSGDPVGARLRIKSSSCQVVGVLEASAQAVMGQDPDDFLVLPLKAAQRRLLGSQDIATLMIGVPQAADLDLVKSELTTVMRDQRRIEGEEEEDFSVIDMRQIAEALSGATRVMTVLLGAVAGVSLLVGGIGIMNIMLVSVTERTREIGIRLAIGALERDVLLQFLIEAITLSLFGGVLGAILAAVASALLASAMKVPYVFDLMVNMLAFGIAAGVGIAFGYFPARRAARLDPIEALRHE